MLESILPPAKKNWCNNKVSRLGVLELDEGHKSEFMVCSLSCTNNLFVLAPELDILLQKRHLHVETLGKVLASA